MVKYFRTTCLLDVHFKYFRNILSPKRFCERSHSFYVLVKTDIASFGDILLLMFMHVYFSMYSRWGRSVFWVLGIRMTVRGEEHLQNDQPCIIVVNHQSSLDLIGEYFVLIINNKSVLCDFLFHINTSILYCKMANFP